MPIHRRAIHPAIWQRKSGEKVLHLAPWQNDGILGHEDDEGDALLEAMIAEIKAKMKPYWHKWSPGELVIWDNWRFVHSASGHSPDHGRLVHRTTIEGDYGLGRWETEPVGEAMEMMRLGAGAGMAISSTILLALLAMPLAADPAASPQSKQATAMSPPGAPSMAGCICRPVSRLRQCSSAMPTGFAKRTGRATSAPMIMARRSSIL